MGYWIVSVGVTDLHRNVGRSQTMGFEDGWLWASEGAEKLLIIVGVGL
jgi:hypothetical protein